MVRPTISDHGAVIRDRLMEIPWTQNQLARKVGLSEQRISMIISGTRPMSAEDALAIGDALGISAEILLELQLAETERRTREDNQRRLEAARRRRKQQKGGSHDVAS